jgi:acyl-CoA reductase-like NAD-dependent aldehyde dehydrogenase
VERPISSAYRAPAPAKAVKKNTLELGGADVFVVSKDADIDKTVE